MGINGNGHGLPGGPPEGAIILTAELLTRTSRKWVKLPSLSYRVRTMSTEELIDLRIVPEGTDEEKIAALRESGVWVQIGNVGALEALSMAPVVPGAEAWPTDPEGRAKAFTEWRNGLSETERATYDEILVAGHNRFISAGLLVPKLPPEGCTMFKDDAMFLTAEIQQLSGMSPPRRREPVVKPTETVTEDPAADAAPAPATG